MRRHMLGDGCVCLQQDTSEKKEQIALGKCNSTAHHSPVGVNSSTVHRHQVIEYINSSNFDFQNY